jgi:hypothetical protein
MGGMYSKNYEKDYCPSSLSCKSKQIPVCWKIGRKKKGFCAGKQTDALYHLQKDFYDEPYSLSITKCIRRLQAMSPCASGNYTMSLNTNDDTCSVTCESTTSGYYGNVHRPNMWTLFIIIACIFLLYRIQKNGKLF